MKILSNKEYETLKQNAFDATMYYHQTQVEKRCKERVIKEKEVLLNDFMSLEEKCRNYKKQIEEYEADSITQNETIEKMKKQIEKLEKKIEKSKTKETKTTKAKKEK